MPRSNRPQKTAMIVAKRIVADIAGEGVSVGTRLPPEKAMLDQYQVGRGTLRESLRYLELSGVLSLKPGPGGGPTVERPDASHLMDTLGLLLQFNDVVVAGGAGGPGRNRPIDGAIRRACAAPTSNSRNLGRRWRGWAPTCPTSRSSPTRTASSTTSSRGRRAIRCSGTSSRRWTGSSRSSRCSPNTRRGGVAES